MRTIRSGLAYGSGWMSTASVTLNIIVFSPMPIARHAMATAVTPLFFRAVRTPNRISCSKILLLDAGTTALFRCPIGCRNRVNATSSNPQLHRSRCSKDWELGIAQSGIGFIMLEARGLTKYYSAITGVRDVNFEVRPGSVLGLLGPNGSGKSTTVGMLTGLLEPSGGLVLLDGGDIRGDLVAYKR